MTEAADNAADATTTTTLSDTYDDANDASSFQNAATRRNITVAYWTVILLCIPYWWFSTTIERHDLPLSTVSAWNNDKDSCPVRIPVALDIRRDYGVDMTFIDELNHLSHQQGSCLAFSQAQDAADSSTTSILPLRTGKGASLTGPLVAEVDHSDSAPSLVHDILYPTLVDASNTRIPSSSGHRAVKYARKYKLVFSLLNENISQGGYSTWDADSAISSSINPLLQSLDALHSFDIETQVQYYSPLSIQQEQTQQGTVISEDQLKAFVNSAEWNLASAVSQDPVLHFLLYVPAADKMPLLVRKEDGSISPLTSFLIPRWGSIVVLSAASSASASSATSTDLRLPFRTFHNDLRALLGVPTIPAVEVTARLEIRREWEVNALMRQRIVQNVGAAKMRLGAIARQVEQIQNMRIPEAVQRDFKAALAALNKVPDKDLRVAMNQSAIALNAATRAAFNHEMLAMLYFPDEHKWAVYTPLFGPIAVPLFVALFREIKQWRLRGQAKGKQKAQ